MTDLACDRCRESVDRCRCPRVRATIDVAEELGPCPTTAEAVRLITRHR